MSLPGSWTNEFEPAAEPRSETKSQKPRRQFQAPNYADPAVTQFCNEHLRDLDNLQNIAELINSLSEQQDVVNAEVCPSATPETHFIDYSSRGTIDCSQKRDSGYKQSVAACYFDISNAISRLDCSNSKLMDLQLCPASRISTATNFGLETERLAPSQKLYSPCPASLRSEVITHGLSQV